MSPLRIHVNAGAFEDAPEALVRAGVRAALEAEGHADAEISVTLLADADIAELHERYLGVEGPTDVLAFALDAPHPLGDVYVGVEQAGRQARELRVALDEELVRLAVHGTLHVLGHEHPDGPERVDSPMFRLQERLVARICAAG